MSSALFYVAFWAWNLETLGFQDLCSTVFYHEYLRCGLANRMCLVIISFECLQMCVKSRAGGVPTFLSESGHAYLNVDLDA